MGSLFLIDTATAAICLVQNGCTGTGQIPTTGQILVGNASGTYTPTSTAFGGGSSTVNLVGSSTAGKFPYWFDANGTLSSSSPVSVNTSTNTITLSNALIVGQSSTFSSYTAGAIPFFGASGLLSQDAGNFNRLTQGSVSTLSNYLQINANGGSPDYLGNVVNNQTVWSDNAVFNGTNWVTGVTGTSTAIRQIGLAGSIFFYTNVSTSSGNILPMDTTGPKFGVTNAGCVLVGNTYITGFITSNATNNCGLNNEAIQGDLNIGTSTDKGFPLYVTGNGVFTTGISVGTTTTSTAVYVLGSSTFNGFTTINAIANSASNITTTAPLQINAGPTNGLTRALRLFSGTGADGDGEYIEFASSLTTDGFGAQIGGVRETPGTGGLGALIIKTGGSTQQERLRVTDSGNVDINNSTGTAKFNVAGNGIFTTALAVGTTTTSTATLNLAGTFSVTQTSTFNGNAVFPNLATSSFAFIDPNGKLTTTSTPSGGGAGGLATTTPFTAGFLPIATSSNSVTNSDVQQVTTSTSIAGGNITFDSGSTGASGSVSPITWTNFSTGSNNNRLMVVGIHNDANTTDVVTAVTDGGVAMTRIGTIAVGATAREYLYALLAPPVGTSTISVTFTGGISVDGASASYFNVNQSGLPDVVTSTASAAATSLSVNLTTTATGDWAIGWAGNQGGSWSGSTNSFIRIGQAGGLNRVLVDSNGSLGVAGTYTFALTNSLSLPVGMVVMAVKPATTSTVNFTSVTTGDNLYINSSTSGVILTSPNGSCWQTLVNNSGTLATNSITCP